MHAHKSLPIPSYKIGSEHPRWIRPRLTRFARNGLERTGWRINDNFPDLRKSVIIVAPHTSNWDFIIGVAASFALDLRPRFIAKHTLFRWPLGAIMRALGGIPVNRASTEGFVAKIATLIDESDAIALTITPEGTRKAVSRWRTGFYHIAAEAQVPIVPCYLDRKTKMIGFGTPLLPSGSKERDLEILAEFYRPYSSTLPTNALER